MSSSDDGDRVFRASEILASLFECPYDCKEFVIIDIVISLGRSEGLRVIGTEMKIPIAVILHQHSTRGNKQGIGHDKKREVGVRIIEDGSLEEGVLESPE